MSVFDQTSTTNTEMATGLGQSDYSLTTNYPKSAATLDSTIASDSWLMPTSETWPTLKGVDCKLVHGDRWQKIEGNMSQHVAQTKWSEYDGDFEETYKGNVTRDMHSPSFRETYCVPDDLCTRDYLGRLYEHYHAGHRQHNDIEEFEVRLAKFEIVDTLAFEVHPFKFEASHAGWSIAIVGELNLAGSRVEAAGLEVGVAGVRREFGGESQKAHAMEEKISAVKSSIGPLRNRLGLLTYKTMFLDLRMGELLATGFVAPG